MSRASWALAAVAAAGIVAIATDWRTDAQKVTDAQADLAVLNTDALPTGAEVNAACGNGITPSGITCENTGETMSPGFSMSMTDIRTAGSTVTMSCSTSGSLGYEDRTYNRGGITIRGNSPLQSFSISYSEGDGRNGTTTVESRHGKIKLDGDQTSAILGQSALGNLYNSWTSRCGFNG